MTLFLNEGEQSIFKKDKSSSCSKLRYSLVIGNACNKGWHAGAGTKITYYAFTTFHHEYTNDSKKLVARGYLANFFEVHCPVFIIVCYITCTPFLSYPGVGLDGCFDNWNWKSWRRLVGRLLNEY